MAAWIARRMGCTVSEVLAEPAWAIEAWLEAAELEAAELEAALADREVRRARP
jgi:hypothetical protein